MKPIVLIPLALIVAGCSTRPPTRPEVVAYVSAGKFGSSLIETTVNRRYEDVVASLSKKAEECVTYKRTHRHHVAPGVVQQPTMHYWVTSRSAGAGKTEITFHAGRNTKDEHAKGASIRAATDVHRVAANRTRVVTYGSSTFGQDAIGKSVKEWAEGKAAGCPEIFFE